MTRDEMLDGLEGGGDPLTLSIKKWEDIYLGTTEGFTPGNCALCQTFWGIDGACRYCPVYRNTRLTGCKNTPYVKFRGHYLNCEFCYGSSICEKGKKLARKEIDFLKKLDKW